MSDTSVVSGCTAFASYLSELWGGGHGGCVHRVRGNVQRLCGALQPPSRAPTLLAATWRRCPARRLHATPAQLVSATVAQSGVRCCLTSKQHELGRQPQATAALTRSTSIVCTCESTANNSVWPFLAMGPLSFGELLQQGEHKVGAGIHGAAPQDIPTFGAGRAARALSFCTVILSTSVVCHYFCTPVKPIRHLGPSVASATFSASLASCTRQWTFTSLFVILYGF